MRICIIGNASNIHIVKWANGLSGIDHEVYLLSADKPGIDEINPKVYLFVLPFRPPAGYYLNWLWTRKLINQIQPDILNTHYASGYGTLSRLINFRPTLLSVWGSDVFDVPYQNRIMFNIVRKNLQAATRIASTSKIMREQVLKLYQSPYEIFVTPFGVDLDIFKPNRKQDSQNITIGIIKTIDEKYGQTCLIKAFKLLLERLKLEGRTEIADRLRLVIIGDGPQKYVVQSLVTQLGLDKQVSIIGRVKNTDVPYYLNQFDIACFPSMSESFGVAAIEASACEVPVIASNIGGLPEVVIDGKTGYLVKPGNEQDLSEKMYHLVIDKELRKKMGLEGRKFVSKNYDWQENLKLMEKYLYQIIEENRG